MVVQVLLFRLSSCAVLTCLKPQLQTVESILHNVSETQEVRHRRKVVVHLVKPSDFNGPILQGIINSEQCIHLRMECDRPLNDVDSWTG